MDARNFEFSLLSEHGARRSEQSRPSQGRVHERLLMSASLNTLLQPQGCSRLFVPMHSGGGFLLFLLLCCTAVCTAVYPGGHPRAEPAAPTCFLLSQGTAGVFSARTAVRRVCPGRPRVRMVTGGGLTGADELADGPKDSRFVSRKLTDALEDMPAARVQVAERGRGWKRAWVRNAASRVVTVIITAPRSLTQRLFPGPEIPPLMGREAEAEAEAEAARQLEQFQRTGATRPVPVEPETASFPNEAAAKAAALAAENERVFDLLDKYSQRHSNGTVPVMATVSESSTRKPLKKSKYADLGTQQGAGAGEEVRKPKRGKVLQKSRYADVWSVQDEAMGKPGARSPAQPSAEGRAGKRVESEEPQSRLEQLMAGYVVSSHALQLAYSVPI